MKYFFHVGCFIMIPVKSISYLQAAGFKALYAPERLDLPALLKGANNGVEQTDRGTGI